MTNINPGVLPAVQWLSRPGAPSLRVSFPGTGVLGVVPTAPRVARDKVGLDVPAPQQIAPAVQQLEQTNIHNYMTSVFAVGEGVVGPPPDRESA